MDSELYGNKPSPDELMTEARARIVWGEPSADVRAFLLSNGVAPSDADAKLRVMVRERNQELRGIGLRNLLIGLVIFGIGVTFLVFTYPHPGIRSRQVKGFILAFGLTCYGFWRLLKGILYLVRPQSEDGSIPDIEEDPLN